MRLAAKGQRGLQREKERESDKANEIIQIQEMQNSQMIAHVRGIV